MSLSCKEDGEARVIYQEYLSPSIRYQYPNENWQYIDGDNYSIEREVAQCSVPYRLVTRFRSSASSSWREYRGSSLDYLPPFTNLRFVVDRSNATPYAEGFPTLSVYRPGGTAGYQWNNLLLFTCTDRQGKRVNKSTLAGNGGLQYQTQTMEFVRFERQDGLPDDCGDCTFTVYKNSEIVHTQKRKVCPTVEKLPSRLDEVYKEIKISKQAYSEVVNVNQNSIPDHCLNVYLDRDNSSEFIAQICSGHNCLPPKYEVICNNNNCESCPENTCSIKCGSKICCYRSDGTSVKSIDISNYCL